MVEAVPFRARPTRKQAGATVRLTPAQTRQAIGDAVQAHLDSVEHLLTILDRIDGDPEAEDGGDAEPELGAPEGHESQVVYFRGTGRDLETDTHPETRS